MVTRRLDFHRGELDLRLRLSALYRYLWYQYHRYSKILNYRDTIAIPGTGLYFPGSGGGGAGRLAVSLFSGNNGSGGAGGHNGAA